MADFCKQCSEELFNEDFGDLANLCEPSHHIYALCEGCGKTIVNHAGVCVDTNCMKHHGASHAEG